MAPGCEALGVVAARMGFAGVQTLAVWRAMPFVRFVMIVRIAWLRVQRGAHCRLGVGMW